ncbi:MAG TPA: PilZ domain-containing protein [Terriglobales bacterium]|nr:PilZ domain-containing protein [Terriglobales bacterium]
MAVRIFGTDAHGRPFSENVSTSDVSREGARVTGLRAQVRVGEIIGLTYQSNKGRFAVKWVGNADTTQEGQVGLENAVPGKPFWDFPLPGPGMDEYGRHTRGVERRQHPRLKCLNSVELHPAAATAPIWSKTTEMGLGGCFVEMPMPLPVGTTLKISLWVKDEKLRFSGKVVNSRPGFGVGIQFTEISPEDLQRLKEFLKSITRIPMK